jgi:hypothetical protein
VGGAEVETATRLDCGSGSGDGATLIEISVECGSDQAKPSRAADTPVSLAGQPPAHRRQVLGRGVRLDLVGRVEQAGSARAAVEQFLA